MGLENTNTNFCQNQFTTDLDQSYYVKNLKTAFLLKILILSRIFLRIPIEKVLLHLFYSYTFGPKIDIKEDIDSRKYQKLDK